MTNYYTKKMKNKAKIAHNSVEYNQQESEK